MSLIFIFWFESFILFYSSFRDTLLEFVAERVMTES